jgi:hypothetical protein
MTHCDRFMHQAITRQQNSCGQIASAVLTDNGRLLFKPLTDKRRTRDEKALTVGLYNVKYTFEKTFLKGQRNTVLRRLCTFMSVIGSVL